ncbi:MAG: galactokinase [Cypionkella sp.]
MIGEHVDYNDGLVLPMPVRHGTAVAWRRTAGGQAAAWAADFDASDRFALADPGRPPSTDWRAYVRGMAAYAPARPAGGVEMAIAGDLAREAGLSSSASLCVAIGRALAEAAGVQPDPTTLALAAQRTEHDYAGVACGIMDQMAGAAGRPGAAMLLDCRDLAYRHVALPARWAVAVVASGVTRGLVEGEYNARRRQCEEAAARLGVASLREATLEQIAAAALGEPLARRARHVVSEIGRVRQALAAIERADIAAMARVLSEGHASLRDDFEVSHPVVDELVERLQAMLGQAGGARMTGAGFGGSVVVVGESDAVRRAIGAFPETATMVHGPSSE